MKNDAWSVVAPFDAIVFDCDGTLSQLEGVDVLAQMNGVGEKVARITAQAMGEVGIHPDLYAARLDQIQPTRAQVVSLGDAYFTQRTPDVEMVLPILAQYQKPLYVLSAGMNPSVQIFAKKLGIPETHTFAVDLFFDAQGRYVDFDRDSLLTQQRGKQVLITQLKQKHARIALVGDGMNDAQAAEVVDCFIGYGGTFYREQIAALSHYYLSTDSFAPLLSLLLTEQEIATLTGEAKAMYLKGLAMLSAQRMDS